MISIHALRGEGDRIHFHMVSDGVPISIHALRGEGDSRHACGQKPCRYFNPRPPWGGRRACPAALFISLEFQSTPSVGRATLCRCETAILAIISIHALRGEGDQTDRAAQLTSSISIHALRGEGDYIRRICCSQSRISIHALRGEGDNITLAQLCAEYKFQSTPSVGRATGRRRIARASDTISIHALRVEGDRLSTGSTELVATFQSTPSVWRAT